MDIAFTSINETMPNTNGSQAFVFIKCSTGNICKGMFYWNGTKPTFVSYGSTVDDVIGWAYDRNRGKK